MMMIPRIKNEFDLLGEMFADPFFTEHESKIMKTDIKEKTDKYLIGIELPGYQKENIKIDVEDGYLTVHAEINSDNEEKEEGKFVRRERYVGSCSRSFYVGNEVKSEDIKKIDDLKTIYEISFLNNHGLLKLKDLIARKK